jgi:adenosylcobinamide-GDP ribazoletransferase
MLNQFITAWQFLTIIPISRRIEVTAEPLGKSMAVFPLVGLLLGCILAGLDLGFSYIFPPAIASSLVLTCYIAMYGGFHLDGLADTVDGLAGGRDREHILKIMKDSSIGAIGVVALILLLLLKYAAITSIPDIIRWKGLLLMPVMGRWTQVWMTYGSSYARESGLGRAFVDYVKGREVTVATAIVVVVSWFTFGFEGVAVVGAVAVFGYLLKSFFHKKIGGVTGDILGAGSELAELMALLIIIGM